MKNYENSNRLIKTLRWQFKMTRKLSQYHLPHLTDEMCLWEPTPNSWTVRQDDDGKWHPDWAESEPDPAPTTTIAWLTWHLIWWWTRIIAVVKNKKPPTHTQVSWPGNADAVKESIETLSSQWSDILTSLNDEDLGRSISYPWKEPKPLMYAIAWVNSELMKNVAEIGYVRHLYEEKKQTSGV